MCVNVQVYRPLEGPVSSPLTLFQKPSFGIMATRVLNSRWTLGTLLLVPVMSVSVTWRLLLLLTRSVWVSISVGSTTYDLGLFYV